MTEEEIESLFRLILTEKQCAERMRRRKERLERTTKAADEANHHQEGEAK